MAAPSFEVGDIARYAEELVVVTNIIGLQGFNLYDTMSLADGERRRLSAVDLKRELFEEFADDFPSAEQTAATEQTMATEQTKSKKPRFATMTEEQLDGVAKQSTAQNTDKSTKWGIKIFKGESDLLQWHVYRLKPLT